MIYCSCASCTNELIFGDLLPKILYKNREFFFELEKGSYLDLDDRKLTKLEGAVCFYCKKEALVKEKNVLNISKDKILDRIAGTEERLRKLKEKYG